MNFIERLTGKDPSALFQDAASAAKARLEKRIVDTAAANPDVQMEAKQSAGQAIGVWLLDHWQFIALAVAGAAVAFYAMKKGR